MVTILASLVALVAAGMLLFLFFLVRAERARRLLREHRSTTEGLADLLNYAAVVDDGVIVCKSGALMAAWLYQGDDNSSATEEQRNMLSFRINQAVMRLGTGWMVHVDAARRSTANYSDPARSHFPDPVTQAIDDERRALFANLGTMYEGYFVLVVTYTPPISRQQRFADRMFDDDQPRATDTSRTMGLLAMFNREVLALEGRLATALKLTRLNGRAIVQEDGTTIIQDDFLRWLQFCITGTNHPVNLPSVPMYLDAVVGGQELVGGVTPKVGRRYVQVVAIEGFPPDSYPGMLSSLSELSIDYRWSTRFIFMDSHHAVTHLEKYRRKWKQRVRGFFDQIFHTNSGRIDQDALLMVEDADAAIAEVNSAFVTQGYYTATIIVMDESRERAETAARDVEKAINALGFVARVESINTLDAFIGSLPGHGVQNVRRPLLNTMNLADLLPISTIWTGAAEAPCPMYPPASPPLLYGVTQGATPFRLNLHVRDVGHSLVFGPTGTGKSTLLGTLAAQMRRYPGMSIYAFDKGLSLYPLTKAIGGSHYRIAADDEALSFCPLQFLETRGDRAWAMEWIDAILGLNGVVSTPAQRSEVGDAIVNLHESRSRTLSEFSVTIQDAEIRDAVRQYTVDGAMGHLLDSENDGLALSNFTVFEVEDLLALGEKYALPVLLYLFRRIERALQGQPAAIILDEAWIMLGHPVFREKIREWLKTLRKANCMVIMATQSLTDALHSGILDVMVESTATKIFLPNVYARDEETALLYRRMGLNQRQIEILASAIPKRQYYYVSENGRRLFDLALGPFALSFVGATDKESLAAIKALEARYGRTWVQYWLRQRGLTFDYEAAA
jgi:type IV secretion system protein TrbE